MLRLGEMFASTKNWAHGCATRPETLAVRLNLGGSGAKQHERGLLFSKSAFEQLLASFQRRLEWIFVEEDGPKYPASLPRPPCRSMTLVQSFIAEGTPNGR